LPYGSHQLRAELGPTIGNIAGSSTLTAHRR
jgi:hypothetical protein